ncbi:M23 family metallopeptidase, partial [Campylobacter jejuni]
GLSGASGRVSGPHLHFGILAGGKQVDPLDFVSKFNAIFQ